MPERVVSNTSPVLNLAAIGRLDLLGALFLAKRQGHVDAIRPLLNALRHRAGFWISNALYARITREADEG